MRAKSLILLAATAALVAGVSTAASAAEKMGKPLNIKPSVSDTDNWRERAMRSRAQAPETTGSAPRGTTRAIDERGERADGEEAGSGDLGKDRGEGGREE